MQEPSSERPTPASTLDAPPTKTRFLVLAVLCLLSGVLYLDRICISQALPSISRDLKLSHTDKSYILMAFTLSYGLFEVPTGRWGDLIGGRRVLTRISIWWSAFTALTGACTGLYSMITVRFLFGAGEAGAFPNIARVLSRWFPDAERGRAQGILLAASQAGGAVAPLLASRLIATIGWRWTFATFGAVGVVWAVGFWRWFRDDPAAHQSVNAAEVAHIGRRVTAGDVHGAIPWAAVVRNPSVWMLSVLMSFASFNSYIYFSWFQTYLIEGRGVAEIRTGSMTSMVLAFSAVGTFFGGVVLDYVVHGAGVSRRRMVGGLAFFLAAASLSTALMSSDPWTATLFTAISCFLTQSTQPLWWSCAIGISGRHVGALFGLMNSCGVIGALSSQYLVGAVADWLGRHGYSGRTQWDPIFFGNVGVLIAAGILWSCFRFVTVESDDDEATLSHVNH
ncbi:MFS transporter [Schlesneria paludicola]|uniref:MFS transporter n=1 Tax=Schlesneria paludicola TaxID=360056 RepID=UPI00029B4BD8|nr:MFS transporter [Schlesneria paludicola]